jgi:hypothetical protein
MAATRRRGRKLHFTERHALDWTTVDTSAFNVTRIYINVSGKLNHIVVLRIMPDVVRQSGLIMLVTPTRSRTESELSHQICICAVQPG